MKENPAVEQVAIIKNIRENTCTFKMSGGKFCGNACRCIAEFMRLNYGYNKCNIVINDTTLSGKSNGKTSEIMINKGDLIKTIEVKNNQFLVFVKGITQIIVQGNGNKEEAETFKKTFAKENKIADALGVMFLEQNRINPFVWVTKAKTFFNETACLSGSIAASLYLQQKQCKMKNEIIQPTNKIYTISIDDKIKASGPISFLNKSYLEVDILEEVYSEIEKTFLKYSDTATIKNVCEKSDKEEFVSIPNEMQFNKPIIVRKTILEKLLKADEWLKRKNKNYQLVVVDGYRSMKEQEERFKEVYERLRPRYLDKTELEFLEKCHEQIAVPTVAGHPTGGAVDVFILDTKEQTLLDFGTNYCEWSAEKKLYYASPEISKEARQNRNILRRAMLKQGFLQYMAEWWHFSYGDKEWAFVNKKKKALYNQKDISI